MIWFNIKELEARFIKGEVSDKLAFNYLLAHLIILSAVGYFSNDDLLWVKWTDFIINLLAVIWAVRKTFKINENGGGIDYFRRFISISFVISIRLIILVFVGTFIILTATAIADIAGFSIGLSPFQKALFQLIISFIYIGIYYYMLLNSFKRINAASGKGEQVETALVGSNSKSETLRN